MNYAPAPSLLLLLASLLTSVACVPPEASDDGDDEDTSTNAEMSSSTETSDSSEPSETDDGTPSSGIGPDDIPGGPASCDPFAQDCAEGEKCVPYPSTNGPVPDADKCVPILGELPPGEPCTMRDAVEAHDDCDDSSVCWDRVDGEHGICRAFCTGTADNPVCGRGEVCLFAYEGSLNVCVPGCDPLLQDCEAGFGCYWTGDVFACSVTSTGVEAGELCGFIDDCNPGLLCTDGDGVPGCIGATCCAPYCDTTLGDAECAALPGTTCEDFYEEGAAPPAHLTLGVCRSSQP